MGKSKKKLADTGILFPHDGKAATPGFRSTTPAAVEALSVAIGASDHPKAKEWAAACAKAGRKWRFGYSKHIVNVVKSCVWSAEDAEAVSQAGIDWVHENFTFLDKEDGKNGQEECFSSVMGRAAAGDVDAPFVTGKIEGKGKISSAQLSVPYKGKELRGNELQRQLDRWAEYGVMEPDTAQTIAMVSKSAGTTLDLTGHVRTLRAHGPVFSYFQ